LAHKGGAGLDQIKLSLGHVSIQTIERYLGVEQDLTDAPWDHLGLRLEDQHSKYGCSAVLFEQTEHPCYT
jgi:hypothetical protein